MKGESTYGQLWNGDCQDEWNVGSNDSNLFRKIEKRGAVALSDMLPFFGLVDGLISSLASANAHGIF